MKFKYLLAALALPAALTLTACGKKEQKAEQEKAKVEEHKTEEHNASVVAPETTHQEEATTAHKEEETTTKTPEEHDRKDATESQPEAGKTE